MKRLNSAREASEKSLRFSVLLSVYAAVIPEQLDEALKSIFSQSLPPDQVIVVEDGPISVELSKILDMYEENHPSVSRIALSKNSGLGAALNVGLEACSNELVARMDADDISTADRFSQQITEFARHPELEILGGQIAEFIDTPDNIVAFRKVPITQEQIKKFSKRRSPFNHPTVMYKKSTLAKLGNYDVSALRIEDYDLWLRALANNTKCGNLDSVLLYYRVSNNTMERRKSFSSLRNHIKARTRFFNKHYISFYDYIYGIVSQIALFILPTQFASKLFNKVVRQ